MKKMLLAALGALVLLAVAFFCNAFGLLESLVGPELVAREEAPARVAFSEGVPFEEGQPLFYTADWFSRSRISYDQYRATLHFDTLGKNEQTLYRVLEFALEGGYPYLLLDDTFVPDAATFNRVLLALALDSPFLEQNLAMTWSETAVEYTFHPLPTLTCTAAFDGWQVHLPAFAAEFWYRKCGALTTATNMADTLPQGLSEAEKALTLHTQLIDAYRFTPGYEGAPNNVYAYLSDALQQSASNADGYANGLALVLHQAGIEAVEKAAYDDSGRLVHTWVCARLDGTWYNLDGWSMTHPRAFSDELQRSEPLWSTVYPPCNAQLH